MQKLQMRFNKIEKCKEINFNLTKVMQVLAFNFYVTGSWPEDKIKFGEILTKMQGCRMTFGDFFLVKNLSKTDFQKNTAKEDFSSLITIFFTYKNIQLCLRGKIFLSAFLTSFLMIIQTTVEDI